MRADKFGTGFTLIRSDIGGNVDRLAAAYGHNSDRYREIFSIILDEVQRGEQEGKQSETNALLWLKRWVNAHLKAPMWHGICPCHVTVQLCVHCHAQ